MSAGASNHPAASVLNATGPYFALPTSLPHIGRQISAAVQNVFSGPGLVMENLAALQVPPPEFSVLQYFWGRLRRFANVFSYVTSKWAILCFTVALVLNRTAVYGATRRPITLTWPVKAAIRAIPIILLASQIRSTLQTIRCQASPEYSMMHWGKANKNIHLDMSQEGGFLYSMASRALFWESDQESCIAVDMVPHPKQKSVRPDGSLAQLWPAYQIFCASQFVEQLSCSIEGRRMGVETSMSLFEHSLAFAEAEAMVANQIGLGPLSARKENSSSKTAAPSPTIDDANEESRHSEGESKQDTLEESDKSVGRLNRSLENVTLYSESYIVSRFNTSPEVLFMTLLSLLNHLSSQLLGIAGLQHRFRLLNTAIWSLSLMASFIYASVTQPLSHIMVSGVFRFPTVCVVNLLPHLVILAGITTCAFIYSLALLISVVSPLPMAGTLRDRLNYAYNNMHITMHLSNMRMHEDFYAALLRVGFNALTAASEAVYLNEGQHINVGQLTWLEEEHLDAFRRGNSYRAAPNGEDVIASGIALNEKESSGLVCAPWKSGYGRERTTKILKGTQIQDGVGIRERQNRYISALELWSKICWLCLGWELLLLDKLLTRIGINYRPNWMRYSLRGKSSLDTDKPNSSQPASLTLEFWMLNDEGDVVVPADTNVDVEMETRKRFRIIDPRWNNEREKQLDSSLYSWFLTGGWWGELDSSGDYHVPSTDDDDLTSIISDTETSTSTLDEWENDSENDSGRRTPTQRDPYPHAYHRSPSPQPDMPVSASRLARLLNPTNPAARAEARMLATHLASDRILTRSQYRRMQGPSSSGDKLGPEEEADALRDLLARSRRKRLHQQQQQQPLNGGDEDNADVDPAAPTCVVCQVVPRTIMSWPCRCLSVCDDCRVNLAMNNFGTCVCCRQEVVGFSKLFIP